MMRPAKLRPVMQFLYCFAYFLLVGHSLLYSQQSSRIQHFTSEEGLSENVIYSIVQDKRGFLWIGTWDGLNRYDGYNFKKFYHYAIDSNSLPGNTIHNLYEDGQGTLWIGTNGGLCKYDPLSEKFSRLFLKDSLLRSTLRISYLNKSELLVQTVNAVLSVDIHSGKLKPVLFEMQGQPTQLSNHGVPFKDAKDTIFICHSMVQGLAIYYYNRGVFKAYNTTHYKIPTKFQKLSASWFLKDARNQHWIVTATGRILVFDENGNFLAVNNTALMQERHSVQSMYNDNEGKLWIGTENGLLQYDPVMDELIRFDIGISGNMISSAVINCIQQDRTGVIWLGTLNGLNKVLPGQNKFRHITAGSGDTRVFNDFILGLYPEKNNQLRVHYNYGIQHFSRIDISSRTSTHYEKKTYPKEDYLKEVIIRNAGNLSEKNIAYFKEMLYQPRNSNSYLLPPVLIADTAERVWYASFNSFGYYSPGENDKYRKHELTHFSGEVYDMQLMDGRFWLATAAEGIVCYDIATRTLKNYMTSENDPSSISSNEVLCVLPEPGGHVWVGTKGGGLNLLDIRSGKFIHYTKEQGLCNNTIYCMVKDNDGMLWLGTSNGLAKFDPVKKSFRNYSRSDGLINSEFNRYSAVKTSDGRLWFGGINGIDHFQPADIIDDDRSPEMSITSVKVFDQAMSTGGPLKLSHNDNFITFEFAVMDFRNPAANKFAYQLAGIDKDWVNVENRNFVSYSTLRPGRYRFLLRGANSQGVWVRNPIEVVFTIRTPWWRTWWFYTLCAAALAGILYALYRFRIRQLKKMMALRTKISQDLHDEVGSTLSGIALYSSLAKKQLANKTPENTEKSLSVIEQTAADMVDKLNDIVWAVNPQNDNLSILLKRLEDYAYEMATTKSIEVISRVDEHTRDISLPMVLRKNIYLVCKESINNAVKYAGCSVITLNAGRFDHQVSFEISDNGRGFDTGSVKKGNGLNNIRARANEIHASLTIDSRKDKGTTIRLTCKIP
jgi:signal transduction histidine kinase/ligand-binding sensor domain-containing protein